MSASHGRNRGRFPRRTRTVPPHVIADRGAWEAYKARTTPEERERHAALLAGQDPHSGRAKLRRAMAQVGQQLGLEEEAVDVGAAFGGMRCCYCDKDVSDGLYVWTFDSRLRCLEPECHGKEVRDRERAGEGEAA